MVESSEVRGKQQTIKGAKMSKLERVFSAGNQWHDRIFYDAGEGKYYDRYSDIYLELDELHKFGL